MPVQDEFALIIKKLLEESEKNKNTDELAESYSERIKRLMEKHDGEF